MPAAGRPAKHPRSPIGLRIAAAREQARLSQEELAEKLGVSQQVVAALERKASGLHSDTIVKLSSILGLSADQLLGISSTQKTASSSRVRRAFERISQLPRKEQQSVLEVLEALLAHKSAQNTESVTKK